jgi:hypothetical protein
MIITWYIREVIYEVFCVNGENNLENLHRPVQALKVRLIEKEFHRLPLEAQQV